MLDYQLIKFDSKNEARKIIRNCGSLVKHSSIYINNDQLYLLIYGSDKKVGNCLTNSTTQLIYEWARSELTDSLEFISYESKSSYVKYGRSLVTPNGDIVIRSFSYLADVMGVINCTTDSFSDGGRFATLDNASNQIISLVNSGCDIIDLGVESTRPDAQGGNAKSEIKYLKIYLAMVFELKKQHNFSISIDTYHSETVRYLIDTEIDFINDVSGNLPLELVSNIIKSGKNYIAMHSLDVPVIKQNILPLDINPVLHLSNWALAKMNRIKEYGIDTNKIILDPGIGFGNNAVQAWYILRHLNEFKTYGAQLLLGHSRKSLFHHISSKKAIERDLITGVIASLMSVDYLRLHEIKILNEVYPVIHNLNKIALPIRIN